MKFVSHFYHSHEHHLRAPELRNRRGTCMVRITVETSSITTLRRLATRVCGDALEFIRIAACDGGSRMRVWLCVRVRLARSLCDAIVFQLPGVLLLRSPLYSEVLQ